MKRRGLCEWLDGGANDRILVRGCCENTETAEALCRSLKKLDAGVHVQQTAKEFYVVTECVGDDFLIKLQGLLDSYDREKEGFPAEIMETRLVSGPVRLTADQHASDDFQMEARLDAENGCGPILLQAGLSFGTGNHPSTRLVIHFLEHFIAEPFPAEVLDIGCGSGILALLCARQGAQKVVGVDVCRYSVDMARQNVKRNDLCGKIAITDTALSEIPGDFDLVLANLTPSVFHRLKDDIKRLCAAGGRLIVSGLQGRQADEIADRLLSEGWREERRMSEGKWQALLFLNQE